MKIAIYWENFNSIGGGVATALEMALCFADTYQVDILSHNPNLNFSDIQDIYGKKIEKINFRYVPAMGANRSAVMYGFFYKNFWLLNLSKRYDLFICICHNPPPFCYAKNCMAMVLFPYGKKQYEDLNFLKPDPVSYLKNCYHKYMWFLRMRNYRTVLTISLFTQRATQIRWGVNSHVLYPPINVVVPKRKKIQSVVSVGRFAVRGHLKRQDVLVRGFQKLNYEMTKNWKYISIGSVHGDEEQNYFKEIQELAQGSAHIELIQNCKRDQLQIFLEEGKIFWHASGFDIDMNEKPELCEHFGMVIVEAMAAGCVPIVVGNGGAPEIIDHGIDGFLWNGLEELIKYTEILIQDEALRNRMADAAKKKAQNFNLKVFRERLIKIVAHSL